MGRLPTTARPPASRGTAGPRRASAPAPWTRLRLLVTCLALAGTFGVSGCVFPGEFGATSDDVTQVDDTGDVRTCPDEQVECASTCVELETNADHCGACDAACEGARVCREGVCVCPEGQAECGDPLACVELDSDSNCGACGVVCAADTQCDEGRCTCDAENLDLCDDVCRDIENDPDHCGGCDRPCADDDLCAGGECVTALLPDSRSVGCRNAAAAVVECTSPDALPGQDGTVIAGGLVTIGTSTTPSQTFLLVGMDLEFTRLSMLATLEDATTACDGLPLGDGEWRLPTRFELLSLMDAHADAATWSPTDAFGAGGGPPGPVWTMDALDATRQWTVDFTDPQQRMVPVSWPGDPTPAMASTLCVRGRAPVAPYFEYTADDDHLERASALRFRRLASPGDLDWVGALDYCVTLPDDTCDWHLASVKELALIADPNTPGMADWRRGLGFADDPGLRDTMVYWSSTPSADGEPTAYGYLDGGKVMTLLDMSQLGAALCVCDPALAP